MTATTDRTIPGIQDLNPEEWREYFDRMARELMGMSGAEFIERWNAGEYDAIADEPEHWDALYLAMLSAGDRPQRG
jgi:hypothetical protein